MRSFKWDPPLTSAARLARDFLHGLDERPVMPVLDPAEVLARVDGPLPRRGEAAEAVVATLAAAIDPALAANAGGRFFGWVTGGTMPVGVATEWLVAAWDQNASLQDMAPGAVAVEAVTARWVLELLGLPAHAGVSFVTGAQMANLVCLLAARDEVLRRRGWDSGAEGLFGAPPVTVVVGPATHGTIRRALRMAGLGEGRAVMVDGDAQGRMNPTALREALAVVDGPVIVCAQAGEVHTGAFDPFPAVVAACREVDAWLHVDGAFGLWAAASPATAHLTAGVEGADSWCTDAHKTLSAPYDCGIAIVRDDLALRRSVGLRAAYVADAGDGRRDPIDRTPEMSRRARATALYAIIRHLGADGVAGLVERLCALARYAADAVADADGLAVVNDVVFNQVLVRVGDDDGRTRAVTEAVRRSGEALMTPSVWRGQAVMRWSVSGIATDEADIDRSVAAVLAWCR